jgi:hypothetical protein
MSRLRPSVVTAILFLLWGAGSIGADNLLRNGDFESGKEPWFSLDNPHWGRFTVGSESSPSGKTNHFARVVAEVVSPPQRIRVFGAVQEVPATSLPARLRFRMRVAGEIDLDRRIYAQAVLIALHEEAPRLNRQIRFVLHGIDTLPYVKTDAPEGSAPPSFAMVMVPRPPEKKGWRQYDLDVASSFSEHHAEVGPISRLRLLLEARYDDLPADIDAGTQLLEVHYDNVVLVPAE